MRITFAFVVAAHAALGGAFGASLAWMGDGGPWALGILATAAAGASGAWAAGRLPRVAAGELIERRFPECRNVLVTADEILTGRLEATDRAQARVFERAAAVLATIEPARALMLERRVALHALVIAASGAAVVMLWRTLP